MASNIRLRMYESDIAKTIAYLPKRGKVILVLRLEIIIIFIFMLDAMAVLFQRFTQGELA